MQKHWASGPGRGPSFTPFDELSMPFTIRPLVRPMIRSLTRLALPWSAVAFVGFLAACADASSTAPTLRPALSPAMAKGAAGGGGGGGGGGVPAATCAAIVVTNNAQTVRNLVMPDIKYNLENCGTDNLSVTVTVSEWASSWSVLCPSPVATPVQLSLAANQKVSGTFPVYRGPCGFTGPVNGVLVQGTNRWQGHNLMLTVTNDADGAVLSSSPFSWQDAVPRV